MIYTTLNKIRAHGPCTGSWTELLDSRGKTEADDEPLAMTHILDTLGLDDCLWAMRSLPEFSRTWRLFACECAERVLPIFEREFPGDQRPRLAIVAARRRAEGEITDDELADAWADAWDAAGPHVSAEASAAAVAASGHACAASRAASKAARDAAGDAEREWQTTRLREILTEGGEG